MKEVLSEDDIILCLEYLGFDLSYLFANPDREEYKSTYF